MKIGIIGDNLLTSHTLLFKNPNIDFKIIQDFNNDNIPDFSDWNDLDFIFICSNITYNNDFTIDIKPITNTIQILKQTINNIPIVLRTTVPPGTCKLLDVHYFPNFLKDTDNSLQQLSYSVLGICDNDNYNIKSIFKEFFQFLLQNNNIQNDNIHFLNTNDAELLKLSTQAFYATKISFFNELFQHSKLNNHDFNTIRQILIQNDSINPSYTQVPGPDNITGFGNHIMKDTIQYANLIKNNYIIKSVIQRNDTQDRPKRDWLPKQEIDNIKNTLNNNTIIQLNQFANQNNIDISKCLEKIHIIDKIIEFKQKQNFNIKLLDNINNTSNNINNTSNNSNNINNNSNNINNTNNNINNVRGVGGGRGGRGGIPTVTQTGPFRPPGIRGQSGIPMQINQTPTTHSGQGFNMSSRPNNQGGFMNLRPGTRQGR